MKRKRKLNTKKKTNDYDEEEGDDSVDDGVEVLSDALSFGFSNSTSKSCLIFARSF